MALAMADKRSYSYERTEQQQRREEALWQAYRLRPCEITLTELVQHYHGLVVWIARGCLRVLHGATDLQELVAAGMGGLLEALMRFDEGRGAAFITYARHRIRGAIMDWLRQSNPLPRSISKDEVKHFSIDSILRVAMNREHEHVGDALDHVDMLISEDMGPEEEFDLRERHELLMRMVRRLPKREQTMFDLYYVKGLTLMSVAERCGVSESRVCQILGSMREWIVHTVELEELGL